MGSVVLVSGGPGSGKTTLSRALAAAHPHGLHLVSDQFYEFIPRLVDPSKPESREQNHTVMRALGACAGPDLTPAVRHMHGQFAELGRFDRYAIESCGPSSEELARSVSDRLAGNELELDWSLRLSA